jgi:hypothetical protein
MRIFCVLSFWFTGLSALFCGGAGPLMLMFPPANGFNDGLARSWATTIGIFFLYPFVWLVTACVWHFVRKKVKETSHSRWDMGFGVAILLLASGTALVLGRFFT